MTTERDDRLRKLEPRLGEKTTRALWLGAQDPKLRKHVDPLISALSDARLGENYVHRKVLLPPPPAGTVNGPVKVGTVWYDGPRGPLGLLPEEMVRHVGIVGSSGSGKTTAAVRIVSELLETGVRVVVFDVKRTWRMLADRLPANRVRVYTLSRPHVSPFHFNFLIPPDGVPAELYDQIVSSVADEVLYGGLGSQSIAREALVRLRAAYPMPAAKHDHFTMAEFSREVQSVSGQLRQAKRAGDWLATAVRIAKELSGPPLGKVINVRRNVLEGELDRAGLIVFETDLFSQPQFTYLVTAFLAREYLKRLDTDKPDELDTLVVFEEAANIFGQPFPQPTFDRMLREVREKGLGIMWLSQSASTVNATAWANSNTLLIFRQLAAKDINAVGSAVTFERPREKTYVAKLAVGECIVRLPDRFRMPFLVKTDNIVKVAVNDERIHDMAMERLRELGLPDLAVEPEPVSVFQGDKEPVRQWASVPKGQVATAPQSAGAQSAQRAGYPVAMAHMLAEVSKSPGRPASYVYSSLGLPKARGHRVKQRLLAGGLAEEDRVPGIGGVQVHLRPSPQGAEWLKAHESLLAKPLVSWSTKRFGGQKSKELGELARQWAGSQGVVKVEEESSDGFAGKWDLLCSRRDGSHFVIELVTGESKGHEAIHVQKAMSAGLSIVLLCLDDGIRQRIRRYLRDQKIEESEAVRLMTAHEVRTVSSRPANDSQSQGLGKSLRTLADK